MAKKKTTEQFIIDATKIHGDKYNYSLVDYKNGRVKIKIICNRCNKEFEQTPENHLAGKGCRSCNIRDRNIRTRKTKEQFIAEARLIHGEIYNYKLVELGNAKTKIKIICNKCNTVFKQLPGSHLKGHGCQKCSSIKKGLDSRKTTKQFIYEAKEVHNDKYNYSLVNYKNGGIKIKIICPIHGVFEQTPHNHLMGHGCLKCAIEKTHSIQRKTTKQFIKNAIKVHGKKYDYKLVEYGGNKYNVKIICKKHGVFEQMAKEHLRGYGCSKCGDERCSKSKRYDNEIFIQKANIIHYSLYSYELTDYIDSITKVKINCKKHGMFKQAPNLHLQGQGCPKCGNSISKPEQELANWIKDNLFMKTIETNKKFYYNDKYKYELDIFIPSLNLGIEFNGLEFHHTQGIDYNGKNLFHKDKYYHRDKSSFFQKEYGIRIIHIWEHEWLFKTEIVKNILKMQLGIKRERIYARKCELRKITNKESRLLFESSHLQGNYNSTINYGLFYNEELVSVMGFSKSTQGKDAEWELTRFSNKLGVIIVGGAKKLLKAFDKEFNYPSLKSFSLNRIFNGKLYEQLGFKLISISKPTYFYHKKYIIIQRRKAQKKQIYRIIPSYTYNKDETEEYTMNKNGYFRVFDTGMSCWLRKKI